MIRLVLAALGGAGLLASLGLALPKSSGCFLEQLSADSVMVAFRPCYIAPGDSVVAPVWRTTSPHRVCDVQVIVNLETEVMQVQPGRCGAKVPASLQVAER